MAIAPTIGLDTRRRMRVRVLRYGLTLTGPALAWIGLSGHGAWCWALPIHAFVLIPLLELLLPPDHTVLNEEETAAALADPLYDLLLYLFVPIQWATLVYFLGHITDAGLSGGELAGRIATMGLMCGIYGINIAHELGHRAKRWERDLARALLLSSLYMHFIIEHNRGHHRHVGTPQDPASARYGEWIYAFWVRTIVLSFRSAWHIEADRLRKAGAAPFGLRNELLRGLLLQAALVLAIAWAFGPMAVLAFLAAALIGILLLETVNYIEHYGLGRARKESGAYGRVMHAHSWNSDHILGRLMLFELTRHSDHHYKASLKYQALGSPPDGPQLPTGYPGMMLLSLLPPLWRHVVDPRVQQLVDQNEGVVIARPAA